MSWRSVTGIWFWVMPSITSLPLRLSPGCEREDMPGQHGERTTFSLEILGGVVVMAGEGRVYPHESVRATTSMVRCRRWFAVYGQNTSLVHSQRIHTYVIGAFFTIVTNSDDQTISCRSKIPVVKFRPKIFTTCPMEEGKGILHNHHPGKQYMEKCSFSRYTVYARCPV